MPSSKEKKEDSAAMIDGPALLALLLASSSPSSSMPPPRLPLLSLAALTHQDSEGTSPLHAAVCIDPANDSGGVDILMLDLLAEVGEKEERTADLLALLALRDGRMRTPLLLAAERGNAAAFLYLWGRGGMDMALVEVADCFGRTALHWWCKHGEAACVVPIVTRATTQAAAAAAAGKGNKRAVVVNARTTSGETALVWALEAKQDARREGQQEEIVKLLLEAGAEARAGVAGVLPPVGEGSAVQGRLRALMEAHLQKQRKEEEEEAAAPPTPAPPAVVATAPAAAAAVAAPVPSSSSSASSLMSFAGRGRGVVPPGAAAPAAKKKLLKIKLKK